MTDRAASSGRVAVVLTWAALGGFLGIFALLATRVADGQDPALRARAAAAVPPRRVLVRKLVERRVIVHLPPSAPAQATKASQQVSSTGAYPSTSLLTRAS
ncbi:MAG: hypothetical protein ACYDHN_13370 [Solirubrobacteraceae bacterium]